MKKSAITISVRMDKKNFIRFGLFDTFILKKRWRSPALFAAIMIAFSAVCFLSGKEQSALLGSVLAVVGLGMPVVYLGTFMAQMRGQAKRLKLPRSVYTLVLKPEGVHIVNDMKEEPAVDLPWDKLYGAFCRKNAVYLYATPGKAFILPNGQASVSAAELWSFLKEHMPKGRAV